jgi:ankyrin repeat protein
MTKRSWSYNYENASASRGEAETPMHGNAWVGRDKALRRLIRRGHDVNVLDDTGESPLHGAASCGQATVVALLLCNGADPNIHASDTGFTPLHWASGWGNLSAVRALVRGGADVRATDKQGRTAHDVAEQHNRPKIAAWLRRHGA